MNTHMSICRVTENNVIKLLQDGVISCVLSQDWRVNRIVPEFINKANFKSILCKKSKLLHLGIGDGKCSRYFDKVCSQFSISDKLYIDPYDVIFLYLKRCNFDQRQVIFWAEVMRDEYLISVCAKKLYNENKNLLYNKDFIICEMLEQEFCQKNNYSFSYNMLLLLVHILNTNPSLLLPVTSMKRVLTPMGKHIIEKKITVTPLLYKHKFSANITIEDIGKIALGCFSASSKIYLSRFENISLLDDMHYDYILASRSDAFLHEKYSEFILNISKYINKDGFYISDGILSSYSYGIFYNNLDEIFSQVGEERVYFVISAKNSTSLPMRDISGIILLGQNADIKKTYSFISQDRLIAAHQILNCEPFIKQCIWTDLFYWATNKEIDLEEYKFGAINNLLYKYIELKRANIHISLEFDNEEMFIKS